MNHDRHIYEDTDDHSTCRTQAEIEAYEDAMEAKAEAREEERKLNLKTP